MRSRRFGLYRRNRRVRHRGIKRIRRTVSRKLLRSSARVALALKRYRGSRKLISRRPSARRSYRSHSRRGGSKLTSSSSGQYNRLFKYRQSGRRAAHLNKRFRRRVAEHLGHPIDYELIENRHGTANEGECLWLQMYVGSTAQISELSALGMRNYAGFRVADQNTTASSAEQYGLHFHVMNHVQTMTAFNASTNAKLQITCYPMYLRRDISDTNLFPERICVLNAASGTLYDTGNNGIGRATQDVDLTPYQMPIMVNTYKIGKPRSFTVHGGGRFNLSVQHSYSFNQGSSTNVGISSGSLAARKGQFKCLLIKMVGALGIVVAGGSPPLIRNSNPTYAARQITRARMQISSELRHIDYVSGLPAERIVGGYTAVVNEEEILGAGSELYNQPTSDA